ncbi:MAG: hypothetical protein SGI89_08190 [bacterium]|nr:hypothetical protein [bacterium]
MRTLRNLRVAIVIIVLSVIAGCNHEDLSPVSSGNNAENLNSSTEASAVPSNHFQKKIKLRPHQAVTFDRRNTGINIFTCISIDNCELIKKNVEVSGYTSDTAFLLECQTKGFWAQKIIVENKSGRYTEIDLNLFGYVDVIIDPGKKDVVFE